MDSKSGVPHFETYYSFFRKSSNMPNTSTKILIIFDFRNTFFKKSQNLTTFYPNIAYIAAAKKLKI